MKDLRMIENELVPVYETSTGEKVVYGTELHAVLEVKSKFADWVKNRFNDCEAVENEDFQSFSKFLEKGGRPQTEYIIKLDTAKEMAMLERNEKGKQVRRYFIEVEKKYKAARRTPFEILELEFEAIKEVNGKIEAVNEDLQELRRTLPLLPAEAEQITHEINIKAVALLGGKESNAYRDKSLRGKIYSDMHRELKRQFGVTKYKYIKSCCCNVAIERIRQYEPPYILAEQIKDTNDQMQIDTI